MITGKGRIRESTGNGGSGRVPEMWDPGEYREGKILVSTGKGRIRASTGKGGIRASTGNEGSGRVLEMWDPGEYRKTKIPASTEKVKSG